VIDKQLLFDILFTAIQSSDLSRFLEYSASYPGLTSQFSLAEIADLKNVLTSRLEKNDEWSMYLVDTNLYKKSNLATFFNEISLATVDMPGEVRLMVPEGIQNHIKGMPDYFTTQDLYLGSRNNIKMRNLAFSNFCLNKIWFK
jgi:hypothetical protein